MRGNTNEEKIWNYLLDKIHNEYGVAGLMGNLLAESGLNPINLQNSFNSKLNMSDEQYTASVDNGHYQNFVNDGAGYGLAQWTFRTRKRKLLNYCQARKTSIGDLEAQLDFLYTELSSGYNHVLNALINAKSIFDASNAVLLQFERPADQSVTMQEKRARYSKEIYDRVKGMCKVRVAIDAGHGSTTAGKRTPDGYREHWINVKTAYYCEQYLETHGIETVRIGWNDTNATDDVDTPLAARLQQIKNAKCDYSVSCHANALGDGKTFNSANGAVTLISNNASYQKDSLNFAKKVHARLLQGTKQYDYGVRTQSLAMCNCVAMGVKAACLVEIGFMTNKVEADLMKTESFCKEQGEDIARGILDYLNIKPTAPKTEQPKNIAIAPINIIKGDSEQFKQIVKNIKQALNTDYGLKFAITDTVDDILIINLGNVILSTTNYKSNITYALQQMLKWWGFLIDVDGIYGKGTASVVEQFQACFGMQRTKTTTKEFWTHLLNKQ